MSDLTTRAACPFCNTKLTHLFEVRPFYAVESELRLEDGTCVEAEYTVRDTFSAAHRAGRQGNGWSFVVTGPHYPERHCSKCANW